MKKPLPPRELPGQMELTSCTLDNIRFWEPAEICYLVDKTGEPTKRLEPTLGTGKDSPKPYSCTYHGQDFKTWDDVKQHMADAKKEAVNV